MASVGNLLTPPNNVPGEGVNPPSLGQDSQNSSQNQANPTYNPGSLWAHPSQASVQYGLPASNSSWMPQRNLLSPTSLSSITRAASSPQPNVNGISSTGASNESYQLPPFPSTSVSTPVTLPAMAASQHQGNSTLGLTGQTPPASSSSQPSLFNPQSVFGIRHPPTPGYGQTSPPPQQPAYAFSSGQSPPQPNHLGGNGSQSKPPLNNPNDLQSMSTAAAHQMQHSPSYQRAFGPFSSSLPAMNGPVMSNLHNPNTQMALVSNVSGIGSMPNGLMLPSGMMPNFTSGQAANMQQMYGPPNPAQSHNPTNERPFKCDQCPQSFNRNHDLKRHKRIHLAVKPYPCGHCDKSFSRKDALKVCVH